MIVFLDFDGVINHGHWFRTRGLPPVSPPVSPPAGWTEERVRWCFDPATAPRLNRLADAGARFVISSTWRLSAGGLEEMRTILRLLGFSGEVIDITPDLSVKDRSIRHHHGRYVNNTRGQEIQAWLDANAYAGPFVILDDDTDMGPLLDRLVHVDDRYGLTDEDVDRALALLGLA